MSRLPKPKDATAQAIWMFQSIPKWRMAGYFMFESSMRNRYLWLADLPESKVVGILEHGTFLEITGDHIVIPSWDEIPERVTRNLWLEPLTPRRLRTVCCDPNLTLYRFDDTDFHLKYVANVLKKKGK